MAHSLKSLLTTLACAILIQNGLLLGTANLPRLEDLSQTEQELTALLMNLLNKHIELCTGSPNTFADLFRMFSLQKQRFEAYQPSISSEDDAIFQLEAIFKEESENFINGKSEGLIAKCNKLFEQFALFVLKSEGTPYQVNLNSNKLTAAVKMQMKKVIQTHNAMLKKTMETTTLFNKVVLTLNVSGSFNSLAADYSNFKQNPIKTLHDSAIGLIGAVNESPAKVGPLLDKVADRVYEYAMANVLISNKRNASYQKWITGLIHKLSSKAQKARLNHKDSPLFKWNVTLMRRLLQLLNNQGDQSQAINSIESFFESPALNRRKARLMRPIVSEAHQKRTANGGYASTDFESAPGALNIIDSFNYLLRESPEVLDQPFLNSVIDKFDLLALATADKTNSEEFLVNTVNNIDIPFTNNQDFYQRLYQSIQEFRSRPSDVINRKKEFEDFDEFINLKFGPGADEAVAKYYLPIKISFAKAFLNDKEHPMTVNSLDKELVDQTKKLLKQNNLKLIDRILLGAFHEKEGKIRKSDLLAKNYIGDICGRQIPTKNIVDLANVKLNVIEDQQPVDSSLRDEHLPSNKVVPEKNSVNRKDRNRNPKLITDSDLSDEDNQIVQTIKKQNTVQLQDEETPIEESPVVDLSLEDIDFSLKKKAGRKTPKAIDAHFVPTDTVDTNKPQTGRSIIEQAEKPIIEEFTPNPLDEEVDFLPEVLSYSDHKLRAKKHLENLIDILAGSLTPQQIDALRQSENILELIAGNQVSFADEGREVELVYAQIIEDNSQCRESIKKQTNK